MYNTYVTLDRVLTGVLWVGAGGLVAADVFTEVNSGDVGLLTGMFAAAFSVRNDLKRSEQREVRAFDLGRESVREVKRGG